MSANVIEMPSECECCDTTLLSLKSQTPARSLVKFMGMWMCPTCYRKEHELQEQSKIEADMRVATSRATSDELIKNARAVDASIQLVPDIHNAYTVQIMELHKAINEDPTIPADSKNSAMAQLLLERYTHVGKIMFDARQVLADGGQQQRAMQTYMNDLANKLRADERAKFQLVDISYNVEQEVKKAKKAAKTSAKLPKKTPSMTECKAAAEKFGVPVELVRMRTTRVHGETAEQAAAEVAKKIGVAVK